MERAAGFARVVAAFLAALRGFATDALRVGVTAFSCGNAAAAVSAKVLTVARNCSRVRAQIELAVASEVSTPLPRTRIAWDSTAEPYLISARMVVPAW